MSLQEFFESTAGQAASVACIVVLFAVILFSGRNKRTDTRALVVSALLVGLAVVLNCIKFLNLPFGGSITACSMLPVVLCGYFFGLRRGIMAGMCVGLLNLMLGPYVIHPLQLLLDYPLAFGALAAGAGLRDRKYGLILCFLAGALGRLVCHVLSGVIFFAEYAPENMNVFIYSIAYNGLYIGVEGALTIVLLSIPVCRHTFERLKKQLEE